jgi:hypothetical protein
MNGGQRAVYVPCGLDGYELCQPVNQDDFEAINVQVNGASRGATWRPIRVRLVRQDEGRPLIESDAPWLGSHALIFKPRALELLGPLLREYGELLPLTSREAELCIYNPTRILDALDEGNSSLRRFSTGRVMMVEKYVFRPTVISDSPVFKIPNLRVSPTFVTQRFVDLWTSTGLRGLEFRHVWTGPAVS